jgi:hypothetical protein
MGLMRRSHPRPCLRVSASRLAAVLAVVLTGAVLPTARVDAVATASVGYEWADFNGDGFGDIAIGSPGEAIGTVADAGAVYVFYGSGSGFSTSSSQVWHQSSSNVDGVPQSGDHFGQSLAVGDFDGDGFDDLAIGVPGEKLGNTADTGLVYVMRGTSSRLTAVGSRTLRQGTVGIGGSSEGGDRFGWALASGNFDNDNVNGAPIDDLAIGVPGEDFDAHRDAGVVHVLEGNAGTGLFGQDHTLSQKARGFEGDAESGDRFGFALASGDFDGSGTDDLAIGSPYESVMDRAEEGIVYAVLADGGNGVATPVVQLMSQDTIFDTAEGHAFEHFGFALAAGDFNRGAPREKKYDDLAIGVPGDLPANSGAVNIVFGTEHGFEFTASKWFQGKAGSDGGAILGSKESNDEFGAVLNANDFDGNGSADLAIGVPGEDFDSADNGGVHVIFSDGNDLDPALGPNRFFSQDSDNIPGNNESGDMIGAAVGSTDFDSGGQIDLVIGIPGEDLGRARDAGAFLVLQPGRGARFVSQDTSGVPGKVESNDQLGAAAG